jgi:putative transposase
MPQKLSFNLVHIVFSTTRRAPLINATMMSDLHAYLAGTVRTLGCDCFRVGGIADHVHIALKPPSTKTAAKIVSEIKTGSFAWMKQEGVATFAWQRGYGLFSVGPADLGALVQYIEGQEAHHRKRDFQEEMRAFFEKYHIAFDERYVWD